MKGKGAPTGAAERTSARARAAAQRVARERAERRRTVAWRLGLAAVAAVAVGLVAWAVVVRGSGADQPWTEDFGRTSMPPWPAPSDPAPGVAAAGLKVSPMEGAALHFHVHLDVFVNGRRVTVPANIGIDVRQGTMSSLHTHDARGVVHIESDNRRQRYTLGQVFNEWQVRLGRDRAGGLVAGDGRTLTAYVNGTKVSGDPAAIRLRPHQEIALVYGPADYAFTPPADYAFAPGE